MGQRLIISEEERSRISGMYGLVNEQKFIDKIGFNQISEDDYNINYNLAYIYPSDFLEKMKSFRTVGDMEKYMRSIEPTLKPNKNWFEGLPGNVNYNFRPFEDLFALYPVIVKEIYEHLRQNKTSLKEIRRFMPMLGSLKVNGEKNLSNLKEELRGMLGKTRTGEETPFCDTQERQLLSDRGRTRDGQRITNVITFPAPFNSKFYMIGRKPYCID